MHFFIQNNGPRYFLFQVQNIIVEEYMQTDKLVVWMFVCDQWIITRREYFAIMPSKKDKENG